MYNVKINNEIGLTFPDGFQEMGEQELARYFGKPADRWGAYDEGQHIILSVSWTKAGFMQSDPEMHLYEIEARLRKTLVNYQKIQSYSYDVTKKKKKYKVKNAVRFEHRVNDSARVHVVDLVVFKHKKNFYCVYYITRKVNAAESRPAFQQILESITLG
ncbi:MAG: hypothetical protein IJG87_07255 [Ruminococcus sp.]|nr:hypothetical protein [Ruminococcus sp.]